MCPAGPSRGGGFTKRGKIGEFGDECALQASLGGGTFTKRFGTTVIRAQQGIQAVPDVTRPELKVPGRPIFFLTCNVRKTGSVVSRSKHD